MKKIIYSLLILIALTFCINVNAEVTVVRDIYSNDGSMKFTFTGITTDKTHEYEYGITKTYATAVEDWYLITDLTDDSLAVKIMTGTNQMRDVINTVDTGYITIKDKTTDTVVLEPHAVDLTIPYLRVTNYVAVQNGQSFTDDYEVNVALRNASHSEAYYKYEKITDENLIKKYKEIKEDGGDFIELESLLKKAPTSGYSSWGYWNGHDSSTGMNGFGYPTKKASAPDEGLYYLWVYFSGENIKNLYGAIIVDNLAGDEADIKLVSITLPSTKTLEVGKSTTLYPNFSPNNATNKIVSWSSSDDSIVTVDNAGKITAKKVGSAIITVVSNDGNKKATCTVTVTKAGSSNSNSITSDNNKNEEKTENTNKEMEKDQPLKESPATGVKTYIALSIVLLVGLSGTLFVLKKKNLLKKI